MSKIRSLVAGPMGGPLGNCRDDTTILYLAISAQDYAGAGGRTRIISEIKYGAAGKYRVVLLCFVPVRKFLRLRALRNARAALQEAAGATVYYVPFLPRANSRIFGSLGRLFSAAIASLICRWHRVVGIHSHGGSASVLALSTKALCNHVWVLADMHGISPEEHFYSSPSGHDPRLLSRLERMESHVLEGADWVFFVSESMKHHYEKKYGVVPHRFSIVPCATPARDLPSEEDRRAARQEYGLDQRFVFAYLGSIRPYQLVDETIRLFKNISKEIAEAFLLVISSHADGFRSRLEENGVDREHSLVVSVDHERVPRILQIADSGFLLRSDSPVNRVSSPNKFAEYCLCGVPVITTPFVGDYSSMVGHHRVGHVISSFSVNNQLLDFIRSVQDSRRLYAERCNLFARRFLSWDVHGEKLRSAYDSLQAASGFRTRTHRDGSYIVGHEAESSKSEAGGANVQC